MNRQQRLEKCAHRLYELRTQDRVETRMPMDANADFQIAQRLEPDTPGSQRESEWSFEDERYVDKFFESHLMKYDDYGYD